MAKFEINDSVKFSREYTERLKNFFTAKDLMLFPVGQTLTVTECKDFSGVTHYKTDQFSLWIEESNLTEVKKNG